VPQFPINPPGGRRSWLSRSPSSSESDSDNEREAKRRRPNEDTPRQDDPGATSSGPAAPSSSSSSSFSSPHPGLAASHQPGLSASIAQSPPANLPDGGDQRQPFSSDRDFASSSAIFQAYFHLEEPNPVEEFDSGSDSEGWLFNQQQSNPPSPAAQPLAGVALPELALVGEPVAAQAPVAVAALPEQAADVAMDAALGPGVNGINWHPNPNDAFDFFDNSMFVEEPDEDARVLLAQTFQYARLYEHLETAQLFRELLMEEGVEVPPLMSTVEYAQLARLNLFNVVDQDRADQLNAELQAYFIDVGELALSQHSVAAAAQGGGENGEIAPPVQANAAVLDQFVNAVPALALRADIFANALREAGVADFPQGLQSFAQLMPYFNHAVTDGSGPEVRLAYSDLCRVVGDVIVTLQVNAPILANGEG
jgi:hypothetical protein